MKKSDLDPKFEALFNKIREEAELTNEKEINDYGAETSDILMPDGRCYEVYTYLDQKHATWGRGLMVNFWSGVLLGLAEASKMLKQQPNENIESNSPPDIYQYEENVRDLISHHPKLFEATCRGAALGLYDYSKKQASNYAHAYDIIAMIPKGEREKILKNINQDLFPKAIIDLLSGKPYG